MQHETVRLRGHEVNRTRHLRWRYCGSYTRGQPPRSACSVHSSSWIAAETCLHRSSRVLTTGSAVSNISVLDRSSSRFAIRVPRGEDMRAITRVVVVFVWLAVL